MHLTKLRCEYQANPLGIDVMIPRMSWIMQSQREEVKQSNYHIQVTESPDFKKMLWDSGQVRSEQSIHIPYGGPALRSRQRCYWRVCAKDNHGEDSGWSEPQFWEMGLLNPSDWAAQWMGGPPDTDTQRMQPCPMLRRSFHLQKGIERARAYVTALGVYRLHLNGKVVGQDLLTPGWTSYDKRLQYQCYDVTNLLLAGENAVGMLLGEGWYKGSLISQEQRCHYGKDLAALVQLEVCYDDGHMATIVSDGTWRYATGPILASGFYYGEDYDARLEREGWDCPGYDDQSWEQARQFEPGIKPRLIAQTSPAVRRMEEIQPQSIIHTPKGSTVLDMGQNMVGFMRLRVSGPAGSRVVLRHGEALDQHGELYTGNLRSARQEVCYTLKEGTQLFEPAFCFQGFRYVEVAAHPGEIRLEDFTGVVIHSAIEQTGWFESDHPGLNQLAHNILWSQKGNFVDVPTDCPQRDERLGWTGDAQVFIRTACYMMDSAAFFTKWLGDVAADQSTNGEVHLVTPRVGYMGSSSGWGDAAVICPWTIYLTYGDMGILAQQWESMRAWVEYIRHTGEDECLWNSGHQFGDWLALDGYTQRSMNGGTPRDLIATAYYAYSTGILAKAAKVLGHKADYEEYSQLQQRVINAFQREFITPGGRIAASTQTAYALVLMFDLAPAQFVPKLVTLFAQWLAENDNHLTTGFLGTPYLCPSLSRHNRDDIAYMLALKDDYPSWLYQVNRGATTIWEHWDGIREDGSFWSEEMNSFNHYAYGAIGQWLFQTVAGLDTDEAGPGYRRSVIAPRPGGGLRHAAARLMTPYGLLSSSWRVEQGQIAIEVCIPHNTSARLVLPNALAEHVCMPAVQQGEDAVLELGSGTYRFRYPFDLC